MKLADMIQNMKHNLRREKQLTKQILTMQERCASLSDAQLRAKTVEFKDRLAKGQSLEDILTEAFAVAREASFRVLGMRHFSVQLMGGIALHDGNLAEMKTGEGKTLTAVCPAYLNALTGKGLYVITVNEYLAQRDCEEMGRVYEFLGLKTGLTLAGMSGDEKKAGYDCDITYGTSSEFVFDYLRDNMVISKEEIIQRAPHYAIIDEIDSILIDESATPLILSGKSKHLSDLYTGVDAFVKSLREDVHYSVNTEKKVAILTEKGMDEAERVFRLKEYSSKENLELIHHINKALAANAIMVKDQDYAVIEGKVHIVDPFTGRILAGRRYTAGLHQAIEAKEGLEIQEENDIMATITYRNYFRLFQKISGMTGTAYTQRGEFWDFYGLNTVVIPTEKPVRRIDRPDVIYITEEEKDRAVIREIRERHAKGQPVLVGTIYIDQSEKISRELDSLGIPHSLLNAKQDKAEAEIVARAGQKGAVTIATNMAGRGTDIKLGEGVKELGGLFILGTQKHDAIRIDNQLRGRSGRQGDLGESVFFVSLDDIIFKRSGKDYHQKIKNIAQELRREKQLPQGEPLVGKEFEKAVLSAQKNTEATHYKQRSSLIRFDAILNRQRTSVYRQRKELISGEDQRPLIKNMIKEEIRDLVTRYTKDSPFPEAWDIDAMEAEFYALLKVKEYLPMREMPEVEIAQLSAKDIESVFIGYACRAYDLMYERFGEAFMRKIERVLFLSNLDFRWVQYLDVVEQMREGIYLQSIGGIDPVAAFNKEAFSLFDDTLADIRRAVIEGIFEATE